MRLSSALHAALLVASGAEALRAGVKVKLSKIQSLTLRKDLQTSHRRVEAIPQVCAHFNISSRNIILTHPLS